MSCKMRILSILIAPPLKKNLQAVSHLCYTLSLSSPPDTAPAAGGSCREQERLQLSVLLWAAREHSQTCRKALDMSCYCAMPWRRTSEIWVDRRGAASGACVSQSLEGFFFSPPEHQSRGLSQLQDLSNCEI